MSQHVRVPTRGENILDLFFCDDEEFVLKVDVNPTILSDHNLINITTNLLNECPNSESCENETSMFLLNFTDNEIDWNELQEKLNEIIWEDLFAGKCSDEIWNIFNDKVYKLVERYVPRKIPPRNKSSIPRDRKILMRKRSKLQKKLHSESDPNSLRIVQEILNVEQKLKESHITESNNKEKKAVANIKENPKYFYQYARSKSKLQTSIGPLIENGIIIYDAKEKANVLLEQYCSVYSSDGYTESLVDELSNIPGPRSLDDVFFTI